MCAASTVTLMTPDMICSDADSAVAGTVSVMAPQNVINQRSFLKYVIFFCDYLIEINTLFPEP